jgi:hypothetical protein
VATGRNDLCPCGSGKKFKKCCLGKIKAKKTSVEDQPVAPAEPGSSVQPGIRPVLKPASPDPVDDLPEPDPITQARDARWREFEGADYEKKVGLFLRTLHEEGLMDEGLAFDMLDMIRGESVRRGDRGRLDALIQSLHSHLPEIYASDAAYYIFWMIANALAEGRTEVIMDLVRQMALLADKHVDLFCSIQNQLAYYGLLAEVVEGLRLAFPKLKETNDIMAWVLDELQSQGLAFEVLNYLDAAPNPDAGDVALLQRLKLFSDSVPESLGAYILHVTGRSGRQWAMEDFELKRVSGRKSKRSGTSKSEDTWESDLYYLTLEFLDYLRRVENVPFTKAEIGRRQLHRYIIERHYGELDHQRSILDAAAEQIDSRLERQSRKNKFRPNENKLVPDRESFDLFLARRFDPLSPVPYEGMAALESLPAWLRFLESIGLIDANLRIHSLADIEGLADDLCRVLEQSDDDPSLVQACKRWRAEAGKPVSGGGGGATA